MSQNILSDGQTSVDGPVFRVKPYNLEHVYPFDTLPQAIAYLRFKNPARMRLFNPIEPERGSKAIADHFSGYHPDDIFSSVAHAVKCSLDYFPDPQSRKVISMRWLGERQYGKEEISKLEGLSEKRVRKILSRFARELEDELVRRELLPDPRLFDRDLN